MLYLLHIFLLYLSPYHVLKAREIRFIKSQHHWQEKKQVALSGIHWYVPDDVILFHPMEETENEVLNVISFWISTRSVLGVIRGWQCIWWRNVETLRLIAAKVIIWSGFCLLLWLIKFFSCNDYTSGKCSFYIFLLIYFVENNKFDRISDGTRLT